MFAPSLLVLLASAGLIEAKSMHVHQRRHVHGIAHTHERRADSTSLAANAIQSGSFVDGTTQVGALEVGQAKSLTSTSNFINNCAGKTLTNGLQILTGSCNGITMGDIPAKTDMVSAMILFPTHSSATIQSDTSFNISVQLLNLVAGSFTNADASYYAAPQHLQGGKIVGHTHITVQDMGANLNPTTALDPTKFAFFKGINDAGNGNGLLQAVVTGGLPAGNYRVCTITAAANHQPVLMPVAQRGTADDCTKFTVVGSGTTPNIAANDGSKGIAAAALAASAIVAGPGAVVTASAASSVDQGNTTSVDKGTSTSIGKGKSTSSGIKLVATSAPLSSSTTNAKAGNGGKGNTTSTSVDKGKTTTSTAAAATTNSKAGNGGKGQTTSASANNGKTTSSSVDKGKTTSSAAAAATTSNKSGSGSGSGKGSSSGDTTQIITVIETFFVFRSSKGGSCPSVAKSGNQFNVLGELFDDIKLAAAAACGHQFTACASFSGPGFTVEECASQKDSCASVASSQSATATAPSTMTASIVIPASATLSSTPGSVIAVSTSIHQTNTISAVKAETTSASKAVKTGSSSPSDALCTLATSTITVDAPVATGTVKVSPSAPSATVLASAAPFSNSSSTSTSSTSTKVSSSSPIGGIAAPAVVNTGDATRPFSVNGNTFVNKSAAVQRACDVQFNACANAVNGQKLTGVTLADCSTQQTACPALLA